MWLMYGELDDHVPTSSYVRSVCQLAIDIGRRHVGILYTIYQTPNSFASDLHNTMPDHIRSFLYDSKTCIVFNNVEFKRL